MNQSDNNTPTDNPMKDREFGHLFGKPSEERLKFHCQRVKQQLPAFKLLESVNNPEYDTVQSLKYEIFSVSEKLSLVQKAIQVRQSVRYAEILSKFNKAVDRIRHLEVIDRNSELANTQPSCNNTLTKRELILSLVDMRDEFFHILRDACIDKTKYSEIYEELLCQLTTLS